MIPVGPPSPRPCQSCPYRRDVASGIWDRQEYDKIERYDNEPSHQPQQVFACHQTDRDSPQIRLCAGWVGCHGGDNLLALRLAALNGTMSAHDVRVSRAYVSPVPLFSTAKQAAEHGCAEIDEPSQRARRTVEKIKQTRTDLRD